MTEPPTDRAVEELGLQAAGRVGPDQLGGAPHGRAGEPDHADHRRQQHRARRSVAITATVRPDPPGRGGQQRGQCQSRRPATVRGRAAVDDEPGARRGAAGLLVGVGQPHDARQARTPEHAAGRHQTTARAKRRSALGPLDVSDRLARATVRYCRPPRTVSSKSVVRRTNRRTDRRTDPRPPRRRDRPARRRRRVARPS